MPLRATVLICVGNEDTEPARPLGVVERAKRPIRRVVHLHDRFDAFSPGERKHIDRARGWHWVSVERDDVKAVPRQMEVNVSQRPGMNKVKPYALAGLHADCITGSQRLITDREQDFLIVVRGREACGAHRSGSSGACG
jgi:hypothetical protein